MNKTHLEFLASPTWATMLETDLFPWIDRDASLGDDVLEIGPGPGLTTDLLRQRAARVTAIEVDDELAAALTKRLAGTNVEVIHGDARTTEFPSGRFSAATCFSVLHHVPTPEAQDEILGEICRLLQPGAGFFASDARDIEAMRQGHVDDTFVPLPLDTLVGRLESAGFADVVVEKDDYQIRFRARKP
jgi:SAM-dependent methyltransferase